MLSGKREIGPQARLGGFTERLLYSREDRLILACVRNAPESTGTVLASGLNWDRFIDRSASCRVTPWVYLRLKSLAADNPVPEEALGRLRAIASCQLVHLMELSAMLQEIVEKFLEKGIEAIVLKGVALAAAVYESPGLRMTDDLDLLVSPADLAAGAGVFGALGFKQAASSRLPPDLHHLPAFHKEDRLQVELHWDIVPSSAPGTIAPEKLWERSRPIKIGTADTRMLGPEHLLLHAALHAAWGHTFSGMLFQLCDIRAVASRFAREIDWEFLLAEARENRIQVPAYWAFRLAVELTGAPIPTRVVNELKPPYARWSPRHAVLLILLPWVAITFESCASLGHPVLRVVRALLNEDREWIAWSRVAKTLIGFRARLRTLGRLLTNP